MTESMPKRTTGFLGLSSRSRHRAPRPLHYQDTYICPACRHGHIQQLTLMDAFSCNFCRHIFSADLSEQTIHIADSTQPMSWKWTGQRWQATHQKDSKITPLIWGIGSVLVLLPSFLIWLSCQLFPPLPGSQLAWFPLFWAGMTLLFHLTMVGWLLAEYYQLPLYVSSKIKLRQAGEFLLRIRS
jgi:rubredoxin